MRSLGGFVLLSGIGVALFVYLPAPVDRGSSLDELRTPRPRPTCNCRRAGLPRPRG